MDEYIKKQDAIDAITDLAGKASTRSAYEAVWKSVRVLKKIPAADVAPVVHGKWEVIHVKNHWDKARCSACKRVFESYEWGSNYCPVCGAKMGRGAVDG